MCNDLSLPARLEHAVAQSRAVYALPLVENALRIANAEGRTVYDSLYLALAVSAKRPLVTADEKLFNALNRGPLGANLCWIEQVT